MLRSPRNHEPRDPLQNDERPLPIGWVTNVSHNVDPGRVYYTNGRQSQWNFPIQAETEQEDHDIGGNLRENLELISNNNDFNERSMDVLITLRMILEDNEQPINTLTIRTYMMQLGALIHFLRDIEVHYVLKHLCEQIFEEIYEKLAKEKQMIDFGYTLHNEDTIYDLDRLNSIYIKFRNIINNISD